MDSAELEGLGRQIAYGAYPLVLRQSRYAGDQPPPASWRGWSQVAAQVGLGSDAAAARTAMEAVARAQAQQTAVLVGDAGGAPEVESPPRPRKSGFRTRPRGSAPSGGGGGERLRPPRRTRWSSCGISGSWCETAGADAARRLTVSASWTTTGAIWASTRTSGCPLVNCATGTRRAPRPSLLSRTAARGGRALPAGSPRPRKKRPCGRRGAQSPRRRGAT